MRTQSLECPKCKTGELEFEIEHESADDGNWYGAGFIEKDCGCEFTDEQIAILEGDASLVYVEVIQHCEPA